MKHQNAPTQIHDALLRAQPQPDAETQRRLEERVIEALRKEQTPMMEENMDSGQLQYSLFGTRHRTQRSILTTAAAMAILVIVGGLLILRLLPTSMRSASPGAQITPPALDTLVPITVENAAQLAPLYSLGTGSLMNAVWSPDGQTIVLATTKGLYVQDANDLNAPGVRLPGVDGTRFSGGVIYSADSTRIAAITGETLPDAAEMLDPESEKPNTFPYAYALMVWDAATGEVLAKLDGVDGLVVGFVEENTQVVTSTCAERVEGVCVDDQYALKFWEIASGQEIIEKRYLFEDMPYLYSPYNATPSLTLSPDGNLLVYLSDTIDQNRLRVVNLETPAQTFIPPIRGIPPYALSSDGKWLVIYYNDNWLLHSYDLEALRADPTSTQPYSVHEYDPLPGIVSSRFDWIRFSGDGSRLVMHNESGQAVRFDSSHLFARPGVFMDETSAFRQFPADAIHKLPGLFYYQQHLNPDGTKVLFQAIGGGALMMYDIDSGEKIQQSHTFHPYYFDLHFSGDTLVGGQNQFPDSRSRLFDLSGETPVESMFPGDEAAEGGDVAPNTMNVTLSEGGRYALYQNDASFNSGGSLMWLDRHTGKNYKLQSAGASMTMGFANDGSALILTQSSFVHRYNFASLTSVNGPLVTITGERKADSAVILQGAPMSIASYPMRAAFSPDGGLVVASASNELRVYNTTTGAFLARLDGLDFPQGREGISFSSDGSYVTAQGCVSFNETKVAPTVNMLTCNEPHTRVWDLTEVYALIETHPDIRPGSVDALKIIPVVNFAVDGTTSIEGIASFPVISDSGTTEGFLIAVGDFFKTQVWFIKTVNSGDAQTPEPLLLATLPGEVQSLAFSSDETLLAVGGPGVVTLWGVAETVSQ